MPGVGARAEKKFESVTAYKKAKSWKLKHHLMQHLAVDILNFGPPRLYWCMRFEAMNQVRNPMPLCMPARPGLQGPARLSSAWRGPDPNLTQT